MTVQLGIALWLLVSVPVSILVGALLDRDDERAPVIDLVTLERV